MEAFMFHVERNEAGMYFAIRNINPPFAFCAKTVGEVAKLAEEALVSRRNIVSREEWQGLLDEEGRLKAQVARYALPAQRGACNRTKAKLSELAKKLRAIDGVIGIDA